MISSLIFIVTETMLAQSLPDGEKVAFTVGPSVNAAYPEPRSYCASWFSDMINISEEIIPDFSFQTDY